MFCALCLQGGGVYIGSGTVSFSSCTITGNTASGVRAHAQNFPSPRWDFHMFWLVLAGRRCAHQQWHGELLIVHHHWQLCACSRSKLLIAPMGFSHVLRLCLQGGGGSINGGTVSFSSCNITGNSAGYVRDHAQKFPSPRWKFLADMQFDSRRSIGIKSCFTRDMCVLMLKISHCPNGKMPC